MYGKEDETLQSVAGKLEGRKETTKRVAIILK